MASGSFNISTSNQYVSGRVDWSSAPNTAGNYSNVTAWMYLSRTNTGSYVTSGNGTFYLNIGGVGFSETMHYTITYDSNTLMIAKATAIAHNADGTKAINISVSGSIPGAGLTVPSQGTDVWLDTIPRASSVSSVSGTTVGSSQTINIGRADTSFTHTVYIWCGNWNTQTAPNSVGASYSWTLPTNIADQYPNATSGLVGIRVTTYSGGTQIGSPTEFYYTATIPASYVPTIGTFTATRVDGIVPSAWGMYVQGYSKATLAMGSVAGAYGSTITKYSITGHNLNAATSSDTTGFLTSTGTLTYTATVTDSRGRTATKNVSITVQPYYTPSIDGSVARCNSAGTVIDAGTYYKVRPTAGFATCSGKNTVTIAAAYKQSSATPWVASGNVSNNEYSSALGGGALSTSFSYDIRLIVTDGLGNTSTVITKITSLFSHMSFKKGFKGFAVGKQMETDNLVDINMPTQITGGLTIDTLNGKTLLDSIYPVGAIYQSTSSTSPAILFGGTWLQITGRFLYATTTNIGGVGEYGTVSSTAITGAQMPSHNHQIEYGVNTDSPGWALTAISSAPLYKSGTVMDNSGSGQGHTHVGSWPAYYNVYIWRRTA